jgi:hypothetical protein
LIFGLPIVLARHLESPSTTTATTALSWPTLTSSTVLPTSLSLTNFDCLPPQVLAIHLANRSLGFVLRRHLNESEAPRFAGKPVFYDSDRFDLAKGRKRLAQIVFGYVTRQIPCINVHSCFPF